MDKAFLWIALITLLSGSVFIVFTLGYLYFGWAGPYRYDLLYFPSPIAYTLNSLTSTGRMISLVLPVVAFSILILSSEVIRFASSKRGLAGGHLGGIGQLEVSPLVAARKGGRINDESDAARAVINGNIT